MQVVYQHDWNVQNPSGVTGVLDGLLNGKSPLSQMLYSYLGQMATNRQLRELTKVRDNYEQNKQSKQFDSDTSIFRDLDSLAGKNNGILSKENVGYALAGMSDDAKRELMSVAHYDDQGNLIFDRNEDGTFGVGTRARQRGAFSDRKYGEIDPITGQRKYLSRDNITKKRLNGSGDNRYRMQEDYGDYDKNLDYLGGNVVSPTTRTPLTSENTVGASVQSTADNPTLSSAISSNGAAGGLAYGSDPGLLSKYAGAEKVGEESSTGIGGTAFGSPKTNYMASLSDVGKGNTAFGSTPNALESAAHETVWNPPTTTTTAATTTDAASKASKGTGGFDWTSAGLSALSGQGIGGIAKSYAGQALGNMIGGPVGGFLGGMIVDGLFGGGGNNEQFQQMADSARQQVEGQAEQENNKDRSGGPTIDTSAYQYQGGGNDPSAQNFTQAIGNMTSNLSGAAANNSPMMPVKGSDNNGMTGPTFHSAYSVGNMQGSGTQGFGASGNAGHSGLFGAAMGDVEDQANSRTNRAQSFLLSTQYPSTNFFRRNADDTVGSVFNGRNGIFSRWA